MNRDVQQAKVLTPVKQLNVHLFDAFRIHRLLTLL